MKIRIEKLFWEHGEHILQYIWKCKGPGRAKCNFEKEQREFTLSDFKTYYQASGIKTV